MFIAIDECYPAFLNPLIEVSSNLISAILIVIHVRTIPNIYTFSDFRNHKCNTYYTTRARSRDKPLTNRNQSEPGLYPVPIGIVTVVISQDRGSATRSWRTACGSFMHLLWLFVGLKENTCIYYVGMFINLLLYNV